MDLKKIEEALDLYGLSTILKDSGLDEVYVLDLLIDMGYINLEEYFEDE